MVPIYFVLVKCLNLGMPYLKSNSGEEEQFKGDQNEGSENYTEYTEDVWCGEKEHWGTVETVFITIRSITGREDQPCAPSKTHSLKAIQGDSWHISPKSFSDP